MYFYFLVFFKTFLIYFLYHLKGSGLFFGEGKIYASSSIQFNFNVQSPINFHLQDSTWEPEANLKACPEAVAAYEQREGQFTKLPDEDGDEEEEDDDDETGAATSTGGKRGRKRKSLPAMQARGRPSSQARKQSPNAMVWALQILRD